MNRKPKDPITEGFQDMQKLLNQWNSASNPHKVYILGNRVHHGLICVLTGLIALEKGDGYAFGASLAGVLDDINDASHWLDFEKGGDPNALIDLV